MRGCGEDGQCARRGLDEICSMCGIGGIVSSAKMPDDDVVGALIGRMAHRGPDGEGQFSADHVRLGMRRLAIIAPATGQQPIFSTDGRSVIVANGEIYNYIELRRELEARGARFSTGSDIETIVHAYELYGLDAVHRLRGMFAFALWDGKRRRLVLGRDRMGEKPLYFVRRDRSLVFASELRALIAVGAARVELDPVAVHEYFHYSFVPEPRTPVKNVVKLPAGHLLVVDVDPWRVEQRRYWNLLDAEPIEAEPAPTLRRELEEVARIVIRSDVPVGIGLSGGLDSSAVAALTARTYPGKLTAFTVGYCGRPPSDEREDARALAEHLELPLVELEIDEREIVEEFDTLVAERDDPIADIAGEGYRAVMRAARRHGIPVLMLGQGGDELFWGYGWVREAVALAEAKSAGAGEWGHGPLRSALQSVAAAIQSRRGRNGARLTAAHPDRLPFYDLAAVFNSAEGEAIKLYPPRLQAQLAGIDAGALFHAPRPWDRPDLMVTDLICSTYLIENGMAQADRLGMASSIEVRLPLVDYRLAEAVIGLRKAGRDDHLPPKAWLRAALEGIVPDWVLERPKRGFTPPTEVWHRRIFARLGALLDDGALVGHGILSAKAAKRLSSGPFPAGAVVPLSFKALVLELWLRDALAISPRSLRSNSRTGLLHADHVVSEAG
jgi:asparagine synthase (glutamine-hydrolysing)